MRVITAEATGREVYIRADDPELVHLLFEADLSVATDLGGYGDHYWQRSRPPDPGAKLEQDVAEDSSLDEDLEDDSGRNASGVSVPFARRGRPSAVAFPRAWHALAQGA